MTVALACRVTGAGSVLTFDDRPPITVVFFLDAQARHPRLPDKSRGARCQKAQGHGSEAAV